MLKKSPPVRIELRMAQIQRHPTVERGGCGDERCRVVVGGYRATQFDHRPPPKSFFIVMSTKHSSASNRWGAVGQRVGTVDRSRLHRPFRILHRSVGDGPKMHFFRALPMNNNFTLYQRYIDFLGGVKTLESMSGDLMLA